MTETVQFRIQLPLALRDRLKTICLRSNVTMTDKVIGLIEEAVDCGARPPAATAPKIAALNDDRLIARVVDASTKLGMAADRLNSTMQTNLEGLTSKILSAIPKPQSAVQIETLRKSVADQDEQRLARMLVKVDNLSTQIIATAERGHANMLAQIQSKHSLRQAMAVGLVCGLGLSAILLWAISGSTTGRSLAVSLTGAESSWKAAQQIAGNGSPLHSAYIAETHALLKSPVFEQDFISCVNRAKTRKSNFNCTLRFPMLTERR